MKEKLLLAAIAAIGFALLHLPAIVEAGARWTPCDPKCN